MGKPAFGLEINLEAIEQTAAKSKRYRAIPATPRAQVDLALVAATSVTAAQIEAVVRREAGELLETLTLFDDSAGREFPRLAKSRVGVDVPRPGAHTKGQGSAGENGEDRQSTRGRTGCPTAYDLK